MHLCALTSFDPYQQNRRKLKLIPEHCTKDSDATTFLAYHILLLQRMQHPNQCKDLNDMYKIVSMLGNKNVPSINQNTMPNLSL